MLSWRRGSLEVRRRLYDMSILPLDRFLTYVDDLVIGRAPGLGVWLTKVEHGASPMLIRHLQHNRVFHEKRVALLSFVSDRRPARAVRTSATRSSASATASIACRSGSASCRRRTFRGAAEHRDAGVRRPISSASTIISRTRPSSGARKIPAMGRIPFAIFSFLSKISSRAPDYFKIPHDGVIEVGFRMEI